MPNYNKVILMGNLTRDVEMRFTPGGTGVGKFGMAVNRKFRDSKTNELREEVTFVDIEVWGKTAEIASQYLSKGKPVFIEGRLKFDQWDDKTTGQKRSKLYVVADRFEFVGGPPGGGQGGQARPATARAPQRESPQAPDHEMGGNENPPEDLSVREEDVPF